MNEHDLQELMHSSAPAPVDVESLVVGGVDRGRRRLRRRRTAGGVGGAAAAAVVVALAVGLASGGGPGSAVDPADPLPTGTPTSSTAPTPSDAPRNSLAVDDSTVLPLLDDLLPGDDDVDPATALFSSSTIMRQGGKVLPPAPGDQSVSVSSRWRDASISFSIGRSVSYGPDGGHDLLRDAARQCREGVDLPPDVGGGVTHHGDGCHEVADGIWAYARTAAAAGDAEGFSSVEVYTSDAWYVVVRVGVPTGSDQATLTPDELLAIALDGSWFSADPPPVTVEVTATDEASATISAQVTAEATPVR